MNIEIGGDISSASDPECFFADAGPEAPDDAPRLTREQQAILDGLEDPDEPPDYGKTPLPVGEEFQRHILSALLTDSSFLLQTAQFLRGSLFTDRAHGFLCDAAKSWLEKYDAASCPPRFFVEDQIRAKAANPVILDVFDALGAAFKPEYLNVCRDGLNDFVRLQETKIALLKYIDGANKGESDLPKFIADLTAANEIGRHGDAGCFVDMVDLLAQSKGYDWLIRDILYASSLTIFAGAAGAGKTVFLLQVLIDLMHGLPVFGDHDSTPATVCWLDYDDNDEHYRDNLRVALGGRNPEPVRSMLRYATRSTGLTTAKLPNVLTTAYLDAVLKAHDPNIIVVDPLRGALAGTAKLPSGWESDSGTMTTLLDPFRTWAHDNNVALIFIHHHNRQGTISGSAAIQACCDVIWDLDRKADDATSPAVIKIHKRLPKTHKSVWEFVDRRYVIRAGGGDQLDGNKWATGIRVANAVWDHLPATTATLESLGKQKFVRGVVRELDQCGAIGRANAKQPYDRQDRNKFDAFVVRLQADAAKNNVAVD